MNLKELKNSIIVSGVCLCIVGVVIYIVHGVYPPVHQVHVLNVFIPSLSTYPN